MYHHYKLKNSENKAYRLKKYLKGTTLMLLAISFAIPNIGFTKDIIAEPEQIKPSSRASISGYYEGPTLPEIPRREPRRTMRVVVTSYNSEPGQTDDTPFITASGSRTRDGVVAANFLPFGTIVRFPEVFGDKEFVVEDRMNKRYYYRADIWMENKKDSIDFGAKYLEIEIL